MKSQDETNSVCFAPDGTRCVYCLKMSGDDAMIAIRRVNLKTGQKASETVFACAEFGPCAQRRHSIRLVSK